MVSGANRGIGAALARRFHADGWLVSLGARNLDQLQSSVQEWADDNVSCHHYDAFNPSTDQAWIASTVATHGRIDGLVNNAGIGHMADLQDLSEELLDEMWAVNVKGPLRLIQATLPLLAASGEGRIPGAGLRLPGERRVRHAHGRLPERLAGPGQGDDGIPAGFQARRRRWHSHLLRQSRSAKTQRAVLNLC